MAMAEPQPGVGVFGRIGHEPVQARGELGRGGLGWVLFGDTQPLADDLGQRPEGDALPIKQAPRSA
jgi:hypothetical protein